MNKVHIPPFSPQLVLRSPVFPEAFAPLPGHGSQGQVSPKQFLSVSLSLMVGHVHSGPQTLSVPGRGETRPEEGRDSGILGSFPREINTNLAPIVAQT